MDINIDTAIFVVFLAVNLAVGLYFSKGTNSVREYAVGNRDFSTATIAATLVATWIGGGFFSLATIAKTYSDGLGYIVLGLGEVVSFFVISYLIAPRCGQLLGSFSIAEALGNIYGKNVRVITALAGLIRVTGTVAIQFKVSATILSYFFGVSGIYGTLIAAFVVIFYSACGGIRAVAYTDIIQFSTFTVFIPILAMIMWGTLDNPYQVIDTINQNPIFDYSKLLPTTNAYEFINYLCLILLFITPGVDPAIFQRIAMSKNVAQAQRSFIIASFAFLAISLVTFWIAILLLANHSNLNQNELIIYIINKYPYIGLKGFLLSAIMAMIMSTADSYINSAAILFTHDVCKPLGIKAAITNELSLSRASSVFIGVFAIVIALSAKDLFQVILGMASFYMPVVTMPLLLTVFGFRSNQRSIILGVTAGFVTTLISMSMGVDTALVAVAANLISLAGILVSHHLLNVNSSYEVDEDVELSTVRLERARRIQHFIKGVKEFNLWGFCKNNTPRQDYVYSLFGLFCIISVFSTMYSIPKDIQLEQHKVLEFVYHTVLISSSILLTFPIWPPTFKQEKFIIVAWNVMLPYILVFAPILLIIVSNFGQFQLMIFMLNMIVIALLLRWQVAVLTVCIAAFLSVEFYKWYIGVEAINAAVGVGLQFKIMYVLLLVSSILIIFLKPKQEYIEATEHKAEALEGENVKLTSEVTGLGSQVTDLNGQVTTLNTKVEDLNQQVNHYVMRTADQQKEIDRLGETSQRILNNVSHELRLPIGNVVNFADMLHETLQKSENNDLLKKMAEEVHKNSYRVSSMILNMLDFATLAVKKVDLDKSTVNLSELVKDRVNQCRKIYQKDKPIDFKLDIEPEVMISVDANYIRQTVDNLVINAINFSEKGVITITVKKEAGKVVFTIRDQGKGIPKNELFDIFTPFKMGSNTESKACGRGVGLALCKSAIEAHGGSIFADSDGMCGAKLQFTLPRTTALH